MKETELAKNFMDFVKFSDVYQEVMSFGRLVDIVAKFEEIVISYEVKKFLNLEVVLQAMGNKKNFHYSYIVAPRNKNFSHDVVKLCKEVNVGIWLMNKDGSFREYLGINKLNKNENPNLPPLFEQQKYSKLAGSNNGKPFTQFSNTILNLKEHIESIHPEKTTIREAINKINHHYASNASAYSSIRKLDNVLKSNGISIDQNGLVTII